MLRLVCQVTLLESTAADKKLVELPQYKELLTTFTKQEVQSFPSLKNDQGLHGGAYKQKRSFRSANRTKQPSLRQIRL